MSYLQTQPFERNQLQKNGQWQQHTSCAIAYTSNVTKVEDRRNGWFGGRPVFIHRGRSVGTKTESIITVCDLFSERIAVNIIFSNQIQQTYSRLKFGLIHLKKLPGAHSSTGEQLK